MKTWIIAALSIASVSGSAYAAAPTAETAKIARVLVNNPDIVRQLSANQSDNLIDVQIETPKSGVFQYTLTFNRSCFCIPSTAKVTILEDLTPTYRDGAIEYTSSLEIKTGD